ncbi:DNA/RNA non-specific endonuclease [Chenggangzhangella methanolivorans]|uniref:DNA/RNA non-specific endonuclease n=1 Tax=Chenggangzhangella methanolivorans TaxID=1437009 RepID=A0A9E6RH80_9HYPH|nr:DNA/RNA non-specific endonuclease [Chenggangzhangella methanolivorans]QZO01401.1 DNA/RNA non-specific endonuclease [Chenggangzhangella methanolivorans]
MGEARRGRRRHAFGRREGRRQGRGRGQARQGRERRKDPRRREGSRRRQGAGIRQDPGRRQISADARTSKVAPNATVSRTEGKNEFTWTTDSEGRFASGEARLKEDFGGGKRPKSETDAQKDAAAKGKDGDQGGHMFAYRFTKGQGEINLVPQDANLNVGAWKKMENEFADWVNNGKEVNVEVVAKRSSGDRPDTFRASYEVTDPSSGKVIYENSKRFENAPGETFDRVSSKDIKNWATRDDDGRARDQGRPHRRDRQGPRRHAAA